MKLFAEGTGFLSREFLVFHVPRANELLQRIPEQKVDIAVGLRLGRDRFVLDHDDAYSDAAKGTEVGYKAIAVGNGCNAGAGPGGHYLPGQNGLTPAREVVGNPV